MIDIYGLITLVVSYLPPSPTYMEAKSHFYSLKYRNPVAVKNYILNTLLQKKSDQDYSFEKYLLFSV